MLIINTSIYIFRSAKKKHGFKKNQTKRFLLYSLYGWGLPTLITAITVTLTKTEALSENFRPNFGHGRCWFTCKFKINIIL